jgi:ribosomal protein S10
MNNTQSINTEDLIRDLTVKNSVSKEVTLPQAISNFFAAKELQLSEKMQKEQLDMETHKEHIELFLKLNEKINMALDDQGSLDISDNKEIQDLIAQAMEAGAVLKSDLLKMNPQQLNALSWIAPLIKIKCNNCCTFILKSVLFVLRCKRRIMKQSFLSPVNHNLRCL